MQDSSQYNHALSIPDSVAESIPRSVPYQSATYTLPEYSVDLGILKKDKNSRVDLEGSAYINPELINLFESHELKPTHNTPQLKENVYQDWFFPLFLLVLAIYTWLRIFYSKYFNQLLQALLNTNLTNQIVRDENILVQRASILFALTFNIIASLFLYLLSLEVGWNLGGIGTGFNRFAFFIIIVSATYTFKFLIFKIIGWLFDLDREMATYIFNIFLINNVLGLVLVPIVALMAYNPIIETHFLTVLSLCLVGIAFLYRLMRGILSGLSVSGFSPLYLFLYLCTLEIAPLLVLIRIVNP